MLLRIFKLRRLRFALLIGAMCIASASCGKRKTTRAPVQPPKPAKIGATERGEATWYGEPYHGRRAASGEIYDMEQLTAAHRTLPFQTWVEVTNLDNGRQVEVRITDRGPFVDGRIIDLSRAAAREIDLLRTGIAKVELRVIEPPKQPPVAQTPSSTPTIPPPQGEFAVQVGAFRDRDRAEALAASLLKRMPKTRVVPSSPGSALWRVWVGEDLPLDAARTLEQEVKPLVDQAVIVRSR